MLGAEVLFPVRAGNAPTATVEAAVKPSKTPQEQLPVELPSSPHKLSQPSIPPAPLSSPVNKRPASGAALAPQTPDAPISLVQVLSAARAAAAAASVADEPTASAAPLSGPQDVEVSEPAAPVSHSWWPPQSLQLPPPAPSTRASRRAQGTTSSALSSAAAQLPHHIPACKPRIRQPQVS